MKRKKFKINKQHLHEIMSTERVYSYSHLERRLDLSHGFLSRVGHEEKNGNAYVCTRKLRDKVCDGIVNTYGEKRELKNLFFEID